MIDEEGELLTGYLPLIEIRSLIPEGICMKSNN
jgi:hypothetical protein